MKKLLDTLAPRGFTFMFAGMFIAILGVGLNCYIAENPRYAEQGPWMIPASVAVAFTGFAVYVFGRVLLFIQRKNYRRGVREDDTNNNDEE